MWVIPCVYTWDYICSSTFFTQQCLQFSPKCFTEWKAMPLWEVKICKSDPDSDFRCVVERSANFATEVVMCNSINGVMKTVPSPRPIPCMHPGRVWVTRLCKTMMTIASAFHWHKIYFLEYNINSWSNCINDIVIDYLALIQSSVESTI